MLRSAAHHDRSLQVEYLSISEKNHRVVLHFDIKHTHRHTHTHRVTAAELYLHFAESSRAKPVIARRSEEDGRTLESVLRSRGIGWKRGKPRRALRPGLS